MAHSLSGTFKKTMRILKKCAGKKSYVHMRIKHIDISESGVIYTSGWATIMHDFVDVITTLSKYCKPLSRD